MSAQEVMLGFIEEIKAGHLMAMAHVCQPNQPAEEMAELRGREEAYRKFLAQSRKALNQMDRAGAPSNIEGAVNHIQAARRLLQGTAPSGYKSVYCKEFSLDSLLACERAVIGYWNAYSENK